MKIRFWSSTEYSGFLQGLMRELTAVGFDARQCYQISEASYRSAKSAPARLFLRFRQYVVYPVQLGVALMARRMKRFKSGKVGKVSEPSHLGTFIPSHSSNDVCVVSTNTFYAPLIATHLHPNVVHLVYDLFPEAMIHSGKWTEGTLKVKVVRWITKQTLKRAKTNVFLGERLKDYVEAIHGPVANAAIIAVGADQSLFRLSPRDRPTRKDVGRMENDEGHGEGYRNHPDLASKSPLLEKEGSVEEPSNLHTFPPSHSEPTILYCGNFGNMHDSKTLFEYFRQQSEVRSHKPEAGAQRPDSGVEGDSSDRCLLGPDFCNEMTWSFHCSGPKRAELAQLISELPIEFQEAVILGGGLDQAAWINTMESAEVALVTMSLGAETVVMPSKTYSAMMAGQAILAIAPEDSDLVDLIKSTDCGWWVEPRDLDGLSGALKQIAYDAELLMEKRENAFRYAHKHFGQDALAAQWVSLFEALGRTPCGDYF